jgi:DNA-binding transcriptional ArsR family regulator
MFSMMVEYSPPDLDRTFAALADPSRRAILAALAGGERRVTEIAAPFDLSLNAVSKHIKALERAGLVQRHVRGRDHFIALAPVPLREAAAWIDQYRAFWEPRLDALAALLIEEQRRGGADR